MILLLGVGIATSTHLLERSFTLLGHRAAGSVDPCTSVFGSGCDAALSGGASRVLGIPLAAWSLVFYAVLGSLLLLRAAVGEPFSAWAGACAAAVAALGAAASVFLALYLLLGPFPLCPLCLVVHGVNLGMAALLPKAVARGPRDVLATLRAAVRWKAVGTLAPLLVGVGAYLLLLSETNEQIGAALEAVRPGVLVERFEREERREIAVSEADPRTGPLDAPVRIVVFSNFACPGCRDLAPELARLTAHLGNRLAVVYKHCPLGTICQGRDTPTPCHAAWAAEAAHRQGRFWAYYDVLFAPSSDLHADEGALLRVARDLGLDLERFNLDRSSEAVRAKVRADMDEAARLGVTATPAVFLDGRRLEYLSYESLERLAQHVLSSR